MNSGLMTLIIDELTRTDIDEENRKEVYNVLIQAFEEYDYDNLDECLGEDPMYDIVYKEIHQEEDKIGEGEGEE